MEQQVTEIIQELSKQLGIASNSIVPHYAKWYFAAGISYCLFGSMLMALGVYLHAKIPIWFDSDVELSRVWAIAILFVLVFIGGLFIAFNVGDIVAPEGIGIHRLIKDIRGG